MSQDAKSPLLRRVLKQWQQMLLYPTVAAAFINLVTQLIHLYLAFQIGVSPDQLTSAKQRDTLFVENYETCLDSEEYDYTAQSGDTTVSTKLCPSGDVLVMFSKPNAEPTYEFVRFDSTQKIALADLLIPPVAAASVSKKIHTSQNVECQKLEEGRLTRRIREADGKCYEQVINTFTGEVISRTEVSCDASCG